MYLRPLSHGRGHRLALENRTAVRHIQLTVNLRLYRVPVAVRMTPSIGAKLEVSALLLLLWDALRILTARP